MNIFNSATKLTLLVLIASLIPLTVLGVLESKVFEQVIIMVVSFYFGQKVNVPLDK